MKYVSILRGINVGGQKTLKMADLKTLYETLGFGYVVSYIQSGNVVFDAGTKSKTKLIATIEDAIEKKYAFHVPVMIRTRSEIRKVVANLPFDSLNPELDGTKVLVAFLSSKPPAARVKAIQEYVKFSEQLVIIANHVYLHCPNGFAKSKLSNVFLEKKLGVQATIRNWKTVLKLRELSE